MGRVIMIWDEIFFKIRVSFYGLVRRKKVLSDSIQLIDTHIDVVVLVIEVHSSVAFGLCIDENCIVVTQTRSRSGLCSAVSGEDILNIAIHPSNMRVS